VTVTDDESRRIEQQPEEVTIAEITEVIRKIFGDDKPAPDAILIPKWSQDRYTRGSYMNWPIGVTDIDFDLLKVWGWWNRFQNPKP
jgi:polyamine oxidase